MVENSDRMMLHAAVQTVLSDPSDGWKEAAQCVVDESRRAAPSILSAGHYTIQWSDGQVQFFRRNTREQHRLYCDASTVPHTVVRIRFTKAPLPIRLRIWLAAIRFTLWGIVTVRRIVSFGRQRPIHANIVVEYSIPASVEVIHSEKKDVLPGEITLEALKKIGHSVL